MSIDLIANLAYILAAALFIFGLKMLGSPATAKRGNLLSSTAMLIAVVSGLISAEVVSYEIIVGGMLVGGVVGALAARLVAMTSMPEMVALFNGSGGASSLLVGWATLYLGTSDTTTFTAATIVLAILIGGLTFTGSLIAYGKLSERINSAAVVFPMQRFLNAAILLGIVTCAVMFCLEPSATSPYLYALLGLALVLGVMAVIPIGGADMPVVISLLNSYSGIAACAAGFAVGNNILIVAGALVGASGIILTNIMCKAMNRSLTNVLFSGFGAVKSAKAVEGEVKPVSVEDAYYILEAASNVCFVPGYGMAVAQAQHVVKELGNNKFNYTYIRPTTDYYSQGTLFANYEDEDEYDDFDYKEPDWVDGDNHYFHISESEIEIESKSTGDVVSLSLKDMGELYLLIRERLLENEEI